MAQKIPLRKYMQKRGNSWFIQIPAHFVKNGMVKTDSKIEEIEIIQEENAVFRKKSRKIHKIGKIATFG